MSFAEEEVAMQLTVCKEPSAGSGHSRCLASGAILMVVMVVLEARRREGLQPTGVRAE